MRNHPSSIVLFLSTVLSVCLLAGCPTGEPVQFVTVPNLAGLTRSAAVSALTAASLRLGNESEEYSDNVPEGRVIRQSPTAGNQVSPFSSVSIVISKGMATLTVPSVVGLTQSAAESAIRNAGLSVGTITQSPSTSVPAGTVISQNPAGGSPASGSSVSLVVSSGQEQVTVPDLRGQLRSAVQALLAEAELVLGNVSEANSDTVPFDRVISSNPAQGALVAPGSVVSVVISIGPEAIVINDITELQKIGNDANYPINANYALGGNIDASTTATWGGGKGFAPIGSSSARFSGNFDGRGFAIRMLTINRSSENSVGLFGYVGAGGTISNVTLTGGSVIGADYVGSLAGSFVGEYIRDCQSTTAVTGEDNVGGLVGSTSGNVESCSASGAVSGSGHVGGMVGWSSAAISDCMTSGPVDGYTKVGGLIGKTEGSVLNCSTEGPVTASGPYVGGLAGVCEDGSISFCSSIGAVNVNYSRFGDADIGGLVGWHSGALSQSWSSSSVYAVGDYAGGLVGYHAGGTISQCLAEGPSDGNDGVGGLTGYTAGQITQCYAMGSSTARDSNAVAGGLVGITNRATIVHSYAAGTVSAGSVVGGLVGGRLFGYSHTVTGSFWDIQTTGVTESQGGEGRTTVQMKAAVTFTSAGWDFTNVWAINEGSSYPYLQWAAAL